MRVISANQRTQGNKGRKDISLITALISREHWLCKKDYFINSSGRTLQEKIDPYSIGRSRYLLCFFECQNMKCKNFPNAHAHSESCSVSLSTS